MKLFVDDIRRCPEGWVRARTVTEAIRILDTQDVTEVSLDHDICCFVKGHNIEHSSEETFEPVARYLTLFNIYLEEHDPDSTIKVRIHTSNFVAGRKMAEMLGIEYDHYLYNEKDYEGDDNEKA